LDLRICVLHYYLTTPHPYPISLAMHHSYHSLAIFFFFNDPATTEIYTLSLHDALPISSAFAVSCQRGAGVGRVSGAGSNASAIRSEEHTSELQSLTNLVCRLLLEKKKKKLRVDGSLRRHEHATASHNGDLGDDRDYGAQRPRDGQEPPRNVDADLHYMPRATHQHV